MKIINELIQIITKRRAKSIKIIGSDQEGTKVNAFYEAALKRQFQTDEEAAQFLFKATPTHSAYKNLKIELTERLINSLFFIKLKQPAFTERQLNYFYCSKYLAAAKILRYLLSVETSIHLFKKVLKRAINHEFTDIIVECSLYLRQYYAVYLGNEDKFNYYDNLFKNHQAIQNAENLAEEIYLRVTLPFFKEKAIKKDTYTIAKKYLTQFDKEIGTLESSRIYLIKFYIKIIMYLSINDYESIITICKKAIVYYEQKDYVVTGALNTALIYQVSCYLQLKQFEKGKALEAKTLSLLREGEHNWYNNRALFFTLAMHTKNYAEAYTIYDTVTKHRKFKALATHSYKKEIWQIYGAYLHFLHEMGRLQEVPFSKFKLGKFINNVPQTAKDKSSVNISILIIQVLFLIIRRDHDGLIDRIEALEKYITRYIQKDQNKRSNTFIRMLVKVGAVGFNKLSLERRVKKYYEQLIAVQSESVNQVYIVEIIPYEDLWALVLESLDRRRSGVRSQGSGVR
jgi:hypothetical protein